MLKGNHFLLKKIELWGHQQKNPSLEKKKYYPVVNSIYLIQKPQIEK